MQLFNATYVLDIVPRFKNLNLIQENIIRSGTFLVSRKFSIQKHYIKQ